MSDSATAPAGDEQDLLAAEYVFGLLCADERSVVERDAARDPALAAAIAAWERWLLPLTRLVPPIPPPAALWPRIEASLAAAAREQPAAAPPPPTQPPPAPPPAPPVARPVRRWQVAAAAGYALAASLAAFAWLRPPPPPPVATALAPLPAHSPVFVAELLPHGGLLVRPSGAVHVPTGRDLQLWLLAAGATRPVSLGVLPPAGVRLPPGSLPPDASGAKILVSLEPRGGSPTGLPTGPVIGGGSL